MSIAPIVLIFFSLNLSTVSVSCNIDQHDEQKTSGINQKTKCDTVTKQDFLLIAKNIKKEMDENVELSLTKAIAMVKVYNKLHVNSIIHDIDDEYFINEYKKLFEKKHLKSIIKLLNCTTGKGMTIYSNKYDLYIGPGSEFRCRDFYTVIN